ncbi:MAG: polysulfide reductase NrfD, partial [Desulfobulbaceae bacterium]|nr:polysulfide reductase NrfD [Desulfobulbaceae bacterium]
MIKNLPLADMQDPDAATPGISKITLLFALLAIIGVGAGLYAQFVGHHNAFANTREMPWGLLIAAYAFFAITSTGLCLLAALSHIFGGNSMAPLANRMVFLSIATIMGAFAIIGLELENPHRMLIYNMLSPNLTSNIWWMGTLYSMAVGFMLVEFFLILTGQYKMAVTLGVMGAIAEVLANTNLGAVFATQAGRPFWYSAQLPIFFLACAFMSGAAAAILFTHLAYKIRNKEMESEIFAGVQTAGKVLALMLFLISVATLWRFIGFYVGGDEMARTAADSLISGPLAFNFWVFEITFGLAVPLLLLAMTKLKSVQMMSTAAVMVLVGQLVSRYDLVVAGQIVPEFTTWSFL